MVFPYGRSSRCRARLLGIVLAAELTGALIVCAILGPARAAKLTGWEQAQHAWRVALAARTASPDSDRRVRRRLPRPTHLQAADIRPDLTRDQVARLAGGAGTRTLPDGWRQDGASRGREFTYRWSFIDGAELIATFEQGRLVSFSLSEPVPR
jgi:hypothetical protein